MNDRASTIDRPDGIGEILAGVSHLAHQHLRLGWYFMLSRIASNRASELGFKSDYKPTRPVPSQRQLMASITRLLAEDANCVRRGIYPSLPEAADSPIEFLGRIRAMLDDLPASLARRQERNASTATKAEASEDPDLPDYFRQDFHFQSGGYLTEDSARLYDIQVETLFLGTAGPMRRACLAPIAEAILGRDQRQLSLLDVACGTGRFLRQVRFAFPRLKLTGLDLSQAYLNEAQRGFHGIKPATWLKANAERIPVADASQDFVTSIFLFHELPPEARRRVAAEFARVLKPGGRLVFMDSLQLGDEPEWDGLLEAFPVRFHEPYYRQYTIEDLDALFSSCGLAKIRSRNAFMSKLMVRQKV